MKFIGPFKEVLTMANLPDYGAIKDSELEIISNAGVLVQDDKILDILPWTESNKNKQAEICEVDDDMVLMPGLIDAHTHICFEGSRAQDYALRLEGKSYLEIAQHGGGILDTVNKTRQAEEEDLIDLVFERAIQHLNRGVTTCEVKSGYGLKLDDELKMLRAINKVEGLDLIPTCLAAHTIPPEFKEEGEEAYLKYLVEMLLPLVKEEQLANRVDIFIEEGSFGLEHGRNYLLEAKKMGFDITIHADQFSQGGSMLAAELGAISADHLEASSLDLIKAMAAKKVTGVVLPGASLGLGMHYAPARTMLDNNMSVAIASDWNPGSAPMGDLVMQAAVLGAAQKLSMAETLAALTTRAARALNLDDRGKLEKGMLADMIAFECSDYREILYQQGSLKPSHIWKFGELLD